MRDDPFETFRRFVLRRPSDLGYRGEIDRGVEAAGSLLALMQNLQANASPGGRDWEDDKWHRK